MQKSKRFCKVCCSKTLSPQRRQLGLCAECDTTKRTRVKEEERRVENALLKAGYKPCNVSGVRPPPMTFIREFTVDFTCLMDKSNTQRAFIDFVVTNANGATTLLEIDERQHASESYSCDTARLTKIHESFALGNNFGLRTVHFVRYNPHAFRNTAVSDEAVRIRKVDRERFIMNYLETVQHNTESDDCLRLMVDYAYYDRETDASSKPNLCFAESYSQAIRDASRNVA
jgi:hypothetical protein